MTDKRTDADEDQLDDKGWLIALSLHLLKEEFPGVYANRRASPSNLKLTSDLGTAATMLTSDPILLALLLRSVDAADMARKVGAAEAEAAARRGGRDYSNFRAKRGNVSIGDAGVSMQKVESRLRAVLKHLGIAPD